MEKLLAAIHCCVCFSLLTFRARAYPEVQLLDGHAQTDQRLLLILLDGFRWDYLDRGGVSLPGFRKVVQRGAKPEYLIPDFPTTSYPNYYSIMTGLHTESHGMTGNYMYDVSRKESFIIGTNHEQFNAHWWNGADPLWTAAVRQNKTVYMYHWPGCEVTIHGLTPTYCLKYTSIPSMDNFRTAITQSLAQLQFQEADVAAIYFELTDSLGHNYGPLSDELMQLLSDLDPIMEYLADSLATYSLSDVNLMIFSDHGMTEVSRSRVINLSDVIQWDDYDAIMDAGALVSIYTKPDTEDKVYQKLRNFHPNLTVYRQSDLPDRWHYKRGKYVAPITAVADLGWFILQPLYREFPQRRKDGFPKIGGHGYDNKEKDMMGFFVGMGPGFQQNVTSGPLHVVDLHQIMCTLLGIRAPPNNASLERIAGIVTYDVASSSLKMTSSYVLLFHSLCLVLFSTRL